MTDYKELVKALRCELHYTSCPETNCKYICHDTFCDTYRLMVDAAAAIESLQAEVDKANKSADAYRAMYFTKHGDITIEKVRELDEIDCHFHSALIRLMYKRIEELESEENRQLPKRGKWITDPHGVRWCSVCDSYYQDVGYGWNYCPNCGAKMEVQYGE